MNILSADTRLGRAARTSLGMAVERSLIVAVPRVFHALGVAAFAMQRAPAAWRWLGWGLSIGLALLLSEAGL